MNAALVFSTLLVPLVSADNHSTDTNSTGGLSGGAIAGIIIGTLAGVGVLGAGVWYFFLKESAMYKMGGAAKSAAPVSSRFGDNNLPMMAMPVNDDEEL